MHIAIVARRDHAACRMTADKDSCAFRLLRTRVRAMKDTREIVPCVLKWPNNVIVEPGNKPRNYARDAIPDVLTNALEETAHSPEDVLYVRPGSAKDVLYVLPH